MTDQSRPTGREGLGRRPPGLLLAVVLALILLGLLLADCRSDHEPEGLAPAPALQVLSTDTV